jgi:hypothetical protein
MPTPVSAHTPQSCRASDDQRLGGRLLHVPRHESAQRWFRFARRISFHRGTNRCVSAIAIRPTGTLIQKIDRHPIPLTSTPPSTGPHARLGPATDPHSPIAFARPSASSVNVLAIIAIATGVGCCDTTVFMATISSSSRVDRDARRRSVVPATCCLGGFTAGIDVTIVNVALPSIQRVLHASGGGDRRANRRTPGH